MKNFKLLLMLLFYGGLSIHGQCQLSAGIKGGAGFGYLSINDQNLDEVFTSSNMINFEGGFFLNYQMRKLYLRPQLLYIYKEGSFDNEQELITHNLQIPLIIGINLLGPLSIEGGPSYTRVLQSTSNFSEGYTIYKNGLGYRFGPVLTFENFSIYSNVEGNIYENKRQTRFSEPFRINVGLAINL